MTRLSGLALLVLLLGGLSPAYAGAGEESRTVTVKAQCVGGGRVTLAHTTTGDTTEVRVRGAGVRNGSWYGSHLLEVGVDDTEDTGLAVRVRDHRFGFRLDYEDTGKAGVLDLAASGGRRCLASFDELPRATIMGSATDSIAVWHPKPRRFVTRGQVDCRPGSTWKVSVEVGFDDWGFGGGSAPHRCNRLGFFRFHQASRTGDPAGAPVELTYVGRNLGTGAVRTLSWQASGPAR